MNYRQGGRRQGQPNRDYMPMNHQMNRQRNELNYKKLFIYNIDYKTTYDDIFKEFARIGKLRYCDVPVEKNGSIKGYAFVEYYDQRLAEVALNKLNDTKIGSRSIKIEFSNRSKEGMTATVPQGGHSDRHNSSMQRNKKSNRDNSGEKRSKSAESFKSNEKYSHSSEDMKSEHNPPNIVSSAAIRKQYLSNFYNNEEFYDKTPSSNEMGSFLNSTLDMTHSTVISTSRCDPNLSKRDYDSRRRERVVETYNEDRERLNRRSSYNERRAEGYESDGEDMRGRDQDYSRRDRM